MQFNILIFDQFPVVRKALSIMMKKSFKNVKVFIAEDVDELFILSLQSNFDLIFLEVLNNDITEVKLLKKIRLANKDCKIIVFSDLNNLKKVIKNDKTILLDKSSSEEKIIQYVRLSLYSDKYFSDKLIIEDKSKLIRKKEKFINEIDFLSERELECAILLIQGNTVNDIAKKLSIAISTVSTYKMRILAKTKTKNIIELSYYFTHQNLDTYKSILRLKS